MAVVAEENEFSRMKDYRKLRAGGMSDMVAREEIWPSTAVGMKKVPSCGIAHQRRVSWFHSQGF